MNDWHLVAEHPRPYLPAESRCVVGWAWDIERSGTTRTVLVELSKAASTSRNVSDAARAALADHGRDAVVRALGDDPPPKRIVIGRTGVAVAA
jgi:hypothetical protein